MAITKEDLGLTDEDLARRVLAYGRLLAPCLSDLDGDPREDAIAILKNVASIAAARLPGLKARAVGDWSWTYLTDKEMGSMIGADDRAVLTSLCGTQASTAGGPVGSFPAPPREYRGLWPS